MVAVAHRMRQATGKCKALKCIENSIEMPSNPVLYFKQVGAIGE
jgi:hypothetical protein